MSNATLEWEDEELFCNGVMVADIETRHKARGEPPVYVPRAFRSEGAEHRTLIEARAVINQTFRFHG